ncbi:putative membrane protein [Streptohalobacillus salinus]|uniref:Putative membrane protein n=1 Tax=Streptohalobacillus salinus TaxID=621096 RepID=A0A2V3WGK0_9BACI|nr:QueT transporter family protein [Streptohalobacillus salinus]PXW92979.1 putative membrane protein [Streptohalobacillus salinus]
MSKTKSLVANALIAALYIAISLVLEPLTFLSVQFRVPEMFNHLVVFNNRYFFGVVLGVFITNLFSPLGMYDLIFGVGHSVISLGLLILIKRTVKNTTKLMIINTLIFTVTMAIIALELTLALELPFFLTYLTTALGEFGVMAIGIPVMQMLNKTMKFEKLV